MRHPLGVTTSPVESAQVMTAIRNFDDLFAARAGLPARRGLTGGGSGSNSGVQQVWP